MRIKLKEKIAIFFGTRPEYLKILPILSNLNRSSYELIFIKQHVDILEDIYFDKFINIPNNKSSNRLNDITYTILKETKNITSCKYILVQGDTQTAMAVALSYFQKKKIIFHLEAGLRSHNILSPFPEESNRRIISLISNYHFCPTKLSKKNLIKEGISKNIFVTGNTSLDNLIKYRKKIEYKNIIPITLHRRENFELYESWLFYLNQLAFEFKKYKFLFILHPNPVYKKMIKKYSNLNFVNHMNHEKLMKYVIPSQLIITDSGGLQEEGSFLNKKVIVCRKETERPEGINTNHLYICKSPMNLRIIFKKIIKNPKINKKSPYGDGKAGKKVSLLLEKICK